MFSSKSKIFWDVELNDFDFLVWPESVGLPNEIIESFQNLKYRWIANLEALIWQML